MKKTLSVFLAALMMLFCLVPGFAAEGENATGTKHHVTFVPPDTQYVDEDAFIFAKTVSGEIQYQPDPEGDYVFFDNRYMLPSNIINPEDVPEERFSPVEWDMNNEIAAGETIAFKVITSEKYNVHTAAVFINGEPAYANAQDEYAVYVDGDITIDVAEIDENGQEALLRNHFNVKLTSGDGYKVMTRKGDNYQVVYYGGDFYFRVKILSGYTASGIKVSVFRGNSVLGGFLDEEDGDMLLGVMGGTEALTSYGIDEDGCRLYKIENITTDCRILVSGVQEESSAGIMAFFKRIIKLLLDIFGIKLDILDSFIATYTVNIDSAESDGVTYEVLRSSSDELAPNEFMVSAGDGVTIVVRKQSLDQNVTVMWTPGNEFGTYATDWVVDYDTMTGEVSYVAVYNIDNISADTQIVIR